MNEQERKIATQKALDALNRMSVKVGLHCLNTNNCFCPECIK